MMPPRKPDDPPHGTFPRLTPQGYGIVQLGLKRDLRGPYATVNTSGVQWGLLHRGTVFPPLSSGAAS